MRSLRLVVVAGVASVSILTGCYTLQPVGGVTPAAGDQVAFDLNDVGRVALGGQLGPSIARVEGRLVGREPNEMVIAVSSVRYVAGGEQPWSGEPIRLRPEHVAVTYQRRLSKARTIAAGAIGLGAVAFLVTRSIVGGGTEDPAPPPRDTGATFIPRWR